jgi:hypothetical protein
MAPVRSFNFLFSPKEDITAIELARSLPLLLQQIPPALVRQFFDELPLTVQRHWVIKEQSPIIAASNIIGG